jgi:hypothetical protein
LTTWHVTVVVVVSMEEDEERDEEDDPETWADGLFIIAGVWRFINRAGTLT